MKLCIPTNSGGLDDTVNDHFGRAPTYTVIDTETNEVLVVKNRSEHMGGLGKPPEHIMKTGAGVLICSGLGGRAIDMFAQFDIEIFVGATGTVRNAIDMWKEGKLTCASHDVACKGPQH